MAQSFRSGGRWTRKAPLHFGHHLRSVQILQLYGHHWFNAWTADSRELLPGWDSRKETKHQWFLIPKPCTKHSSVDCSTALAWAHRHSAGDHMPLLTRGVLVFLVKTILTHPRLQRQACMWSGNVISEFLYIPPWGLARRRLSKNICWLEWRNDWINDLCNRIQAYFFFYIFFDGMELKIDWEFWYFQPKYSNTSMLLGKAAWP